MKITEIAFRLPVEIVCDNKNQKEFKERYKKLFRENFGTDCDVTLTYMERDNVKMGPSVFDIPFMDEVLLVGYDVLNKRYSIKHNDKYYERKPEYIIDDHLRAIPENLKLATQSDLVYGTIYYIQINKTTWYKSTIRKRGVDNMGYTIKETKNGYKGYVQFLKSLVDKGMCFVKEDTTVEKSDFQVLTLL